MVLGIVLIAMVFLAPRGICAMLETNKSEGRDRS
jgi:ABC-type branched-subunit amino acid transport system permease subunit